MSEEEEQAGSQRFSLIVGGPFNALLGRCGLLGADSLPTPAAAFVLASLAWLLPGVLAFAQSLVDADYDASGYFADVSAVARLFIAIGMMIVTEKQADARLSQIVREFWAERIVVGEARTRFFEYLRAADRQSGSGVAQLAILVAAWFGAGRAMQLAIEFEQVGWEGAAVGAEVVMSWAGLAARHFSVPLFQFLMLLWLWRLGVWSLLLFRISRLQLQLTPLHADRVAGLGFLGLFPGVFRGFAFALSCVVASLLYKDINAVGGLHDIDTLRNIAMVWVGCVLLLFTAPLCVFYPLLFALRESELTGNGRRVNRWYHAFHGRWLEEGGDTGLAADEAQPRGPSLGDLNAALDALREMRTVPLDRATLVQLLLATAAPLIVVGATQIPLRELLGRLAGFAL